MVPDRMRKGVFPSVKLEPLTCRPTSRSLTPRASGEPGPRCRNTGMRVTPTEVGPCRAFSSRAPPSDLPLWEALQRGRYQEPGSQAQEAHQPHQEQEGLHARETDRQRSGPRPGRSGCRERSGLGGPGAQGRQACTAILGSRHAKARSPARREVGCADRLLLNHGLPDTPGL